MTPPGFPESRREDRRTSVVLRAFMARSSGERISLGELRDALSDRAYGALLFVFALPNLLPVNIPGLAQVLGLPLILLSVQLAYGRPKPYFPAWLASRSFRRSDLEKALDWGLRYLERIERGLRPRLGWLTGRTGERVLGIVCLVLSLAIMLPVPLSNWLPALAICTLSLSLIEKDGIAYLIGMVVGGIGMAIAGAVGVALVRAAFEYLPRALSG